MDAEHVAISDLREKPMFFDTVADRIWRAWWQPRDVERASIVSRLGENMGPRPIPFALVAYDGETFVGTASAIACDLEGSRLTPWIAAVWVDEPYRRQKVGRSLVAQAASACFTLGFGRAYLCAAEARRQFYLRQGWTVIDENVGPRRLLVFAKDAGTALPDRT